MLASNRQGNIESNTLDTCVHRCRLWYRWFTILNKLPSQSLINSLTSGKNWSLLKTSLQNPRGHGLPCAAPGRTVGSSGGLTQSGGCSKRRSIPATVPAAPTPLARSAPPARCPGPISGTIYHVPLLRSPTTTPEPLPLLPLCPTALYHAMLWYTPSMRTRVPSFGQTFPNKVGPCQKLVSSVNKRRVGVAFMEFRTQSRACGRCIELPPVDSPCPHLSYWSADLLASNPWLPQAAIARR